MLYKVLFVVVIIIVIMLLKFGKMYLETYDKLNIKSIMFVFDMPIINLHRITYKRFGLYLIWTLTKENWFYVDIGEKGIRKLFLYEKLNDKDHGGFKICFKRLKIMFIVEK